MATRVDLFSPPGWTCFTRLLPTYAYDPSSKRPQTITVNGVTFTIGYQYNSTSQIASITTSVAGQTGNAVTTTFNPYTHEPADSSTMGTNASLLGGITVIAGTSTLYSASGITYNPNGQIITDNINSTDASGNSQTNNYVYTYGTGTNDNGEDANSITQVTDNGTVKETYAYDGVGNFIDPALGDVNTLNQYAALSYNLRGDVTNDRTYAYTYDANDRMISVTPDNPTSGSDKLTYGYDSQGRRAWKDVYVWDPEADGWEYSYARHYVYDGTDLVGELDAGNVLLTGYTWGPNGQLLAVTDYTQGTPKTYEAVDDAQGDTAMLVDPTTASVGAVYTYDSYGNLLTATGPVQAICDILGKGIQYDIEARSIGHALNRDFRLNIWYERDPAGEIVGGPNLYQYLGGDPIDLSDTNGTSWNDNNFTNSNGDFRNVGAFFWSYEKKIGDRWVHEGDNYVGPFGPVMNEGHAQLYYVKETYQSSRPYGLFGDVDLLLADSQFIWSDSIAGIYSEQQCSPAWLRQRSIAQPDDVRFIKDSTAAALGRLNQRIEFTKTIGENASFEQNQFLAVAGIAVVGGAVQLRGAIQQVNSETGGIGPVTPLHKSQLGYDFNGNQVGVIRGPGGTTIREGTMSVVPRRGMDLTNITAKDGRVVPVYGQEFSSSMTNGHAQAIAAKARQMAQSGDYQYVVMQRAWRTATGRMSDGADSRLIPDIIGVRTDGRVDAYEVWSNSDTEPLLRARLKRGMESLPLEQRGNYDVVIP